MTTAALPRPSRRPAASPRFVRWVVASAWTLLGLGVLAGVGVLLFLHRGDAEGSARIANLEVEALLERGERVEQRLPVMQRHWWNWYRVTHGILAATDRRLLYVGVPPAPLVSRGFEPLELLTVERRYARAVVADFGRAFLGTRPGLRLTAAAGATDFAFAPIDRARADSVVAVLTRRQAVLRAAAEAERRAAEATVAASRRAIYHLVQRGEAIDGIARRYGVRPESIVSWNALASSRITAGRRLLVKPGVP